MASAVPFLRSSGDLDERPVDANLFRRRGRKVLLKEFVIMAEARQRVGTHAARARGDVSGTSAKMYRQKGTGNARHGSSKAPQLRGGGVAFAKKPKDYAYSMPRKARRAALEAALRGKLEDGEVRVVERFAFEQPRTKAFLELVGRLQLEGSCLVAPASHDDALWRSCRNVPGASYCVVADLNAYTVLRSRYLILDEAGLRELEERFRHG